MTPAKADMIIAMLFVIMANQGTGWYASLIGILGCALMIHALWRLYKEMLP